MTIAWMCFASTGIFIARFTRPVGGDQSCFGKKIWFQVNMLPKAPNIAAEFLLYDFSQRRSYWTVWGCYIPPPNSSK